MEASGHHHKFGPDVQSSNEIKSVWILAQLCLVTQIGALFSLIYVKAGRPAILSHVGDFLNSWAIVGSGCFYSA